MLIARPSGTNTVRTPSQGLGNVDNARTKSENDWSISSPNATRCCMLLKVVWSQNLCQPTYMTKLKFNMYSCNGV